MAIAVPAGEPMSEGWMVGRGATPLPDHDPVRIPGDRRAALYNDRRANGIPLHPNLVKTLEEIAGELQVPKLG